MAPYVCIPLQLSDFMLNCAVIDDPAQPKNWCVGPLPQPDYSKVLQYENDPQQHIDLLHLCKDSKQNSRVVDPCSGNLRQNRVGFYLQWHLPQVYRAVAEVGPGAHEFKQETWTRGFRSLQQNKEGNVCWKTDGVHSGDHQEPTYVYRAVPNRWLVWRWIDVDTVQPPEARPFVNKFEVFHIESDRCRNISDLGPEVDIEVDVSPFVQGDEDAEEQADTFLGCKYGPGAEKRPKNRRPEQYVPLSVFNSSNPLFVDFQPHNGNVFSMIDTFSYQYNTVEGQKATGFMTEATANYTVLGWVDNPALDILADETTTHGELLKKLGLHLSKIKDGDELTAAWLSQKSPGRAVCHGSLYEVKWTAQEAPKNEGHTLASFMQLRMPVAIGHSTLDSCGALSKRAPEEEKQGKEGEDGFEFIDDLFHEAQTFTMDPAEAASSEIAQRDRSLLKAFARSSPGVLWKLIDLDAGAQLIDTPSPAKPSLQPSDIQKLTLMKLRYLQAFRDSCHWELTQLQWDLFAAWWKLKTGEEHMTPDEVEQSRSILADSVIQKLVDQDIGQLLALIGQIDGLIDPEKVEKIFPEAQRTPDEPFYHRKEPTVTLAGFRSGWNSSRAGALQVRVSAQLAASSVEDEDLSFLGASGEDQEFNEGIARAIDILDPKPDGLIYVAIRALIYESCVSREGHKLKKSSKTEKKATTIQQLKQLLRKPLRKQLTSLANLKDDQDTKDPLLWRGIQFRPLFVEWEAVYFHLPFDKWSVQPSEFNGFYWGLNEYIGKGYASDIRSVSGRELLRPQLTDEFSTLLKAVLGRNWAEPDDDDEDDDGSNVSPNLSSLSFMLKGFSHHLSTRVYGGTHLTPSAKIYGTSSSIVQQALAEPAFTHKEIRLMGDSASRETPYAGTVNLGTFNSKEAQASGSPFKPVTHGQMVLTKLNVVDVFGQVISAIDIDNTSDGEVLGRAIYPYVSDAYSCSTLVNPHGDDTKIANTVIGDQDNRSAFIQIPPSINQQARLNASFVTRSSAIKPTAAAYEPFRPIYEQWENPVWGWVVVNYANHGIQFFLPDGKFFGQVLLGGRTGSDVPVQWQPFEEPQSVASLAADGLDVRRLHDLMEAFRGQPSYLEQFILMIGASIIASPDADASYSETQASLTGRCVALVDFGVSLQLAERPRENESTINTTPPELLLEDYQFPCLFGDDDHRYDGLVGYFGPSKSSTSNDIDFSTCYTYFAQPEAPASECKTVAITVKNAPLLQPYYVNPIDVSAVYGKDDESLTPEVLEKLSVEYSAATSQRLQIFSAIINPYSPLHIRTGGLLPTKTIQLAPWTVKGALEKIDVFFSCGPILSTVNPLEAQPPEKADKFTSSDMGQNKTETQVKVEIPTPSGTSWAWMQPIFDGKPLKTKYRDFQTTPFPKVSEQDILRADSKEPLTAIEGYLLLQRDKERQAPKRIS